MGTASGLIAETPLRRELRRPGVVPLSVPAIDSHHLKSKHRQWWYSNIPGIRTGDRNFWVRLATAELSRKRSPIQIHNISSLTPSKRTQAMMKNSNGKHGRPSSKWDNEINRWEKILRLVGGLTSLPQLQQPLIRYLEVRLFDAWSLTSQRVREALLSKDTESKRWSTE